MKINAKKYVPFWRGVMLHAANSQTGLSAAGCAFFATLSLFPALSALIPLYGLAFDPETIGSQLEVLQEMLPPEAYELILHCVNILSSKSSASMTVSLIIALIVALWSASAGSKAMLSAINIAYGFKENRSIFAFQSLGLLVTLLGILGTILTISSMVALPAIVDNLPQYLDQPDYMPPDSARMLQNFTPVLAHWVAPGCMVFFVFLVLTFLYRFAPCWITQPSFKWILPGAFMATIVWIAVTILFSWYLAHFDNFNSVYGPFGTVATVMMWFFVSVYAALFGAVLNAEIRELERLRELNQIQLEEGTL
ncbi:YihY/virulence factor BrkB family protein [Acetobacteraceae bacterium]|nr:YihY/virulence factor BrkB family protein [Acetobacteraceae bacterium]